MTKDQIKLIHVAKGKAGLSEPDYRTMLRNVGGVDSSKQLTNETFEDCMAFLEDAGYPGHYWRDKVLTRGTFAGSRMAWMIRQLYAQFEAARDLHETHYELAGLVARVSARRGGHTTNPDLLHKHEAWKLIEQLKQMIARLACNEVPGPGGKHWPAKEEPAPF